MPGSLSPLVSGSYLHTLAEDGHGPEQNRDRIPTNRWRHLPIHSVGAVQTEAIPKKIRRRWTAVQTQQKIPPKSEQTGLPGGAALMSDTKTDI